jgi:exodeoxyribonuclease-1
MAEPTFYFYDLETSGISPRSSRIMQFGGQRTDMNLKMLDKPMDQLISLSADILPEPDAIVLTGITPQKAITEGITEAEFLKLFYKEVIKDDTIIVGYNNVRFDDEFIRFLNYRNFYDPYEWQWKNGCSRWDILDVVRMCRALRPEGIKWPVSSEGKPTNKLTCLTAINKLDHDSAHDALSDVHATISVANLIKTAQPDLFNFLLSLRSKRKVAKLVETKEPFVYTSSHYSSAILHTSIVYAITPSKNSDSSLVYDLRQDPKQFLDLSVDELINIWRYNEDPKALRLPVKTLKYNRVPAIAPLGVIKDDDTRKRLDIDLDKIKANLKVLKLRQSEFAEKMLKVVDKLDESRSKEQATLIDDINNVDERLYENFLSPVDKPMMQKITQMSPSDLINLNPKFRDGRLNSIFPLYLARNYKKLLNSDQIELWQSFCFSKLTKGGESSIVSRYFKRIEELKTTAKTKDDQYILEELSLYGQSILQDIEAYGAVH